MIEASAVAFQIEEIVSSVIIGSVASIVIVTGLLILRSYSK